MGKFYKDIELYSLAELLLATPFSSNPIDSFNFRLDEDTFFKYLYADRRREGTASKDNDIYDIIVERTLSGKMFVNVNVLHITGVVGCGMTTYIHHLLLLYKSLIRQYEVIDCYRSRQLRDPLISRITRLIEKLNLKVVRAYFNAITTKHESSLFELSSFSDMFPHLLAFSKRLNYLAQRDSVDRRVIYRIIDSFEKDFDCQKNYLRFLLTVEFLSLFLCQFVNEEEGTLVLVIDNVEFFERLDIVNTILPAIAQFVEDCRNFLIDNYGKETTFLKKSVGQVCEDTRLTIILATSITTEQRFKATFPNRELMDTWTAVRMPLDYYDHSEIISKRVNYYLKLEGHINSLTTRELFRIRRLAEVAYHNMFFVRLFDGSIRFCIRTLCDLVTNYPDVMIQEMITLYSNPVSYEGAFGYFLALVLDLFKNNGIYDNRLHLEPCSAHGEVTLSRIVLTILREKGGRCSLLDIFILLTPLGINAHRITKTVWDLSESGRMVWKRLICFEVLVPTSVAVLSEQEELYEKGFYDIDKYSELVISEAGQAYLAVILPHFEFMQSRATQRMFHPLFANNSEEITAYDDDLKYRFESIIARVFNDVCECCDKSFRFAEQIMEKTGLSREEYLYSSFFNYHAGSLDIDGGKKQSYESRLIFSHVSYIEKYRRYLLKKYEYEGLKKQIELNRRIIPWIIKYLELYQDSERCFQTPGQDYVAEQLINKAKKILHSTYLDYDDTARIELI